MCRRINSCRLGFNSAKTSEAFSFETSLKASTTSFSSKALMSSATSSGGNSDNATFRVFQSLFSINSSMSGKTRWENIGHSFADLFFTAWQGLISPGQFLPGPGGRLWPRLSQFEYRRPLRHRQSPSVLTEQVKSGCGYAGQ